jgi:hypothetical protein
MKKDIKKLEEYTNFLSFLMKDMFSHIMFSQRTIVQLGKALNKLVPYAERIAPTPEVFEIVDGVRDTLERFMDEQERFAKKVENSEGTIRNIIEDIGDIINEFYESSEITNADLEREKGGNGGTNGGTEGGVLIN